MQFDLFDRLLPLIIEVAPQVELPKVLAQHQHGVQLDTHFVPYQLRRSKRRSIGFLVADDGLRVSAPRWVTLAEINAALVSKQRWILTKLREQQNRPPTQLAAPTIWTTGATLPYLGQVTTLHLQPGSTTHFDETTGLIKLDLPSNAEPERCKKYLYTWLQHQARHHFGQRLHHFAERLGVQFHSFALTNAKTLWGTCNVQGKIRLNLRLIYLAPHLIDYVIAHELAHILEMNHSPRFWAKVGSVFPDYVAARSELRKLDMKTLPQL